MHLDDSILNEYVDGRLSAAADRQARKHLGTCPVCRARLVRLETLTESLEALPEVPLTRDLVRPVLARLAPRPGPRWLGWMTALEAVGGTALAAYVWPRLAEWMAPFAQQLAPAASVLWSETLTKAWDSGWSQLVVDVRSLEYAADLWLRSLSAGSVWTWPFILSLGVAALVVGALGNGVLLRLPVRRT